MNIQSTETVYTRLANAIDSAGPAQREVFLAMLSLKLLLTQDSESTALTMIDAVLHDATRPQGGLE